MTDEILVDDLIRYCEDTEYDCNVYVYINDVPIGFGIERLDYDFDGSLKIIIKDETITIQDEEKFNDR